MFDKIRSLFGTHKNATMSACTGAVSENGGTISVRAIAGGVAVEVDNGHKLVRKLAIATADIPAVAEALRAGKPIQRRSSLSSETFIIKRSTGLSAPKEIADDPSAKLDAMLRKATSNIQRDAMRSGRSTDHTPHCCTGASQAWVKDQPYNSTLIIYANNTAAWLHDDAGKPAELASLLEHASEGAR